MKTFSIALVAVLAVSPALSQTSGAMMKADCSEASMKMANDSMMKMSDATKKNAAMQEMNMAKEMMAKKDQKNCMMHMEKAMGMMK
jgi:hypothetical protein